MNVAVRLAVLLIIIFSSSLRAGDLAPEPELSDIRVTGEHQEFDFKLRAFRAEGDARIVYGEIAVTADSVGGSFLTGAFEAEGEVVFTQGERIIRGQGLVYNYRSGIGSFSDARASIEGFLVSSQELVSSPEGYILRNSRFTMCDQEPPHYYLSAAELRIQPGDSLHARKLRMVAFGNTLFSIPNYSLSLKDGERNGLRLPPVGVSGRYGAYIEHSFDITSRYASDGRMTLRLSTMRFLQGNLTLSSVAGTPLRLRAAYLEPHYAGRTDDVLVSRLPELTWEFHRTGDPGFPPHARAPLALSGEFLNPLLPMGSRRGIGVIAQAGLGYFMEKPSRQESTRADLRVLAWMSPVHLSQRTTVMPAAAARYSRYWTGDDYVSIGAQLAVARELGTNSYLSLTYLTHAVGGSTPFDFDPVEIEEEIAGKIRFPIGGIVLDLGLRYDLREESVFDSQVSITKRLHCLEPKLTWRHRSREISLSLTLVDL